VDFQLTDEQQRLRETVMAFARSELEDDQHDREFSRDRWRRCAEFGVTGLPIEERFGGQGADPLTVAVGLEALGYGCRDNGLLFSISAHLWAAAHVIQRFGTEAQRALYLPGLCDGTLIGGQAMTEPESGSDAFALRTTAKRRGEDWILNGSKTLVTNAPVADLLVVFASTDPTRGWAGLSAFLVERESPGLTVEPPAEKMGLQSSPIAGVQFDDCRIPGNNLLGAEGGGMMVFDYAMDWERGFIVAPAVGTMARQVEQCVEYARTRCQFGEPIANFQAVAHRIVDMKLRVDAARLLLYQMAWLKAQGRRCDLESSELKLAVSEYWVASSLDQIQIHGGHGYLRGLGLEADLRDAVASRLYSGTSEIQRNLVAHRLGLGGARR
jgi:alkylation response protein AidB-like acyl-CoA dehydrogenase